MSGNQRRIVAGSAVALSLAAAPCVAAAPRFSVPFEIGFGANPTRMVAADLDGDGHADLATADWSSATVSVRLGTGNGSFRERTAYRTARHPVGLALSDVDGDGRPDLVSASTGRAGPISVFLNRGAGRFRRAGTYPSGRYAWAVAPGDVNHDGIVDLMIAHSDRRHLSVLEGLGGGRFRLLHRYEGGDATDVALGDLNGDGHLDAVLTGPTVAVRLGTGDGSFGAATRYRAGGGPFGVTVVDINNDAGLDLTVANYGGGSVSVLLGVGDGTFGARLQVPMQTAYDYTSNVDTVLAADYDRDGIVDIATPAEATPLVRRGNGDGTFQPQQALAACCLRTVFGAVADFDGNGWPDLVFADDCNMVEFPRCRTRRTYAFLNWTGDPAPPCVVRDLRGLTLRAATRKLERGGCRLGEVRHRHAPGARKGRVIRPNAGDAAVLPSRAPVDVVVSRGPR